MICYTQNFENLIGLTSSMVSITTNTNYYPIITDRAEARGEDPEALIQKLQDHSYYARGLVYAETEQSVKAIQDFMKVSDEGRSTFDRYYEALGLAAFKANVWELARLGLKGYLAEHDADWSWLHMLGVSHLNLGAYKAAESNFLQAISLNTNAVDSYAYLSGLYSTCEVKEMRDGSRALELIDTAFEISEKPTAFLYDMKACALAELGEFEESIRYAQQAMEIAQQDSTLAGYSTGLAQRMSAFKSGNAWTEHLQQLQKIEQEPGEGREISSRPSG
jgi:tetratricopeptide (TPR) repeat protein